jgi:hypothetical protein
MLMQFKVKYKQDLACYNYENLNLSNLVEFFAENGYDYIYVYHDDFFCGVLTFRDILNGWIGKLPEVNFIREATDFHSIEDIEKFFSDVPSAERLVLRAGKEVFCEIDPMSEPPLQNNPCKNMMALRYVDFFKPEIEIYLGKFSSILIIATNEVFDLWQSFFPNLKFEHLIKVEPNMHVDFNLIMDFRYGPKLLRSLHFTSKTVDFNHVIERIALGKLLDYCNEQDVILKFYKLPRYDDLTCLSTLEQVNQQKRTTVAQLADNEEYMKRFTHSQCEYDFIKKRKFNYSIKLDTGYCYSMEDCLDCDINVDDGQRRTIPTLSNPERVLHFYGPCTTYGILVPDDETVTSCLTKLFKNSGINIQSVNHGGLHGNNVMNSIMCALDTKVQSGDALIFLDVLDDFTADRFPGLIETCEWYNRNKAPEDVQFFDFPGHCNLAAYQILAEGIKRDLSLPRLKKRGALFNYFMVNSLKFNPLKYFSATSAAVAKMRTKIKKRNQLFVGCKIGAMLLNSSDEDGLDKELIENALKYCDKLYLFMCGEKLGDFCQCQTLLDAQKQYADSTEVLVCQIEHAFVSVKYAELLKTRESLKNRVGFIEKTFCKSILVPSQVSVRFFKTETSVGLKKINQIAMRASQDNGIEIVELE